MKDDYRLQRVSKRYSQKQSLKNWDFAAPEIIDAVEKLLVMNKGKVLQSLPNSSKTVQKANIDITNFINQFIRRLSPVNEDNSDADEEYASDDGNDQKLRLPLHLSAHDFDYDFQLKKYNFLQNLLSNELKLVQNLKNSKALENKEKNMWERYTREYEEMYSSELVKLNQELEESLVPEAAIHTLDSGTLLNMDLQIESDEEVDPEVESVLRELESHLSKLRSHTDHLSALSLKLDDIEI